MGTGDPPERAVERDKKLTLVVEYGYVLEVARRLRDKPGLVRDDRSEAKYGEFCAQLLEEGVAAAREQKIATITIDWW